MRGGALVSVAVALVAMATAGSAAAETWGGGLTTAELASLAHAAHELGRSDYPPPSGYALVVRRSDPKSGLAAAALYQAEKKLLVLTFGAGPELKDLLAGLGLVNSLIRASIPAMSGMPMEKKLAMTPKLRELIHFADDFLARARSVAASQKLPVDVVVVVGHSLGGFVAQTVALGAGLEAHGFNTAGAGGLVPANPRARIVLHSRKADFALDLGARPGTTYLYPPPRTKRRGFFKMIAAKIRSIDDNHAMAPFVRDLKAGMAPLGTLEHRGGRYRGFLGKIASGAKKVFSSFKRSVKKAFGGLRSSVRKAWSKTRGVAKNLWGRVKGWFRDRRRRKRRRAKEREAAARATRESPPRPPDGSAGPPAR